MLRILLNNSFSTVTIYFICDFLSRKLFCLQSSAILPSPNTSSLCIRYLKRLASAHRLMRRFLIEMPNPALFHAKLSLLCPEQTSTRRVALTMEVYCSLFWETHTHTHDFDLTELRNRVTIPPHCSPNLFLPSYKALLVVFLR